MTNNHVTYYMRHNEIGMYREAHLQELELSSFASLTDYAALNAPETWTDAERLPVPQPLGLVETEHEAEGYSVAVDNSVSDPMQEAASVAGAVIGNLPWGCCWLPQGVLGKALCVLADSASVTASHQGLVVAFGWLRTWAV